jgi:conjugative transfer signal peptidase TraF
MLFKATFGLIITAAIVIYARQIIVPPEPRLLYNPSQSAAVGWYRVQPNLPIERGSQVAAYAPERARRLADERGYLPYDYPLIKTVWAVEGEEVCYHNQSVSVPKRPDIPLLGQDALGRVMPQMSDCIVLKSEEYLLISPDVQNGFDSRYFGPVGKANIIGRVKFIGSIKNKKSSEIVGFVGFGG